MILDSVLQKARSYEKLSADELAYLFEIKDPVHIEQLYNTADSMRRELVGDVVTYVKNRNVNFTNICRNRCKFCAYRREREDPDSYFLRIEEILKKLSEDNISEVCVQGGLNPELTIEFYGSLLKAIKTSFPHIHIHGFSPMEIKFISEISRLDIENVLKFLKDSGLGSMPGTAAEILADEVRKNICPDKLSTDEWVRIVKTAHGTGIPTTSTIMFGHIEKPVHRAQHLRILREIQEETGGFTEFIPLPFIHLNTRLSSKYGLAEVPIAEIYKMYAISRIYFGKTIRNIQASWVKIGLDAVQKSLLLGVNDLGGTLGEERISQAAGSKFGQCISEEDLKKVILAANRISMQRDTLYRFLEKEKEEIIRQILSPPPLFS